MDMAADFYDIYSGYDYAIQKYQMRNEMVVDMPKMSFSQSLKPGQVSFDVEKLSSRLKYDYPFLNKTEQVYNDTIESAVKDFQQRYGLDTDGVVGRKTMRALNMSDSERISLLRESKRRFSQIPYSDKAIIVNIPGYELWYFEKGRLKLKSKVIVGRTSRKTPVFSDNVSYVEMNPYWNIPKSIFYKDKLPEILGLNGGQAKIQYFNYRKYRVFDKKGKHISPDRVKWSRKMHYPRDYRMSQLPGKHNALGKVKFMFPNKYSVYLHDTPKKELFDKSVRTFSSGCIRVERANELLDYLIPDRSKTEMYMAEGNYTRKQEKLEEPVAIHVVYLRSWVDKGGKAYFVDDIYDIWE